MCHLSDGLASLTRFRTLAMLLNSCFLGYPPLRQSFQPLMPLDVSTRRTHTLGRYALATCLAHAAFASDDRCVDLDHPGCLFLLWRHRDRGRSPARAEECRRVLHAFPCALGWWCVRRTGYPTLIGYPSCWNSSSQPRPSLFSTTFGIEKPCEPLKRTCCPERDDVLLGWTAWPIVHG